MKKTFLIAAALVFITASVIGVTKLIDNDDQVLANPRSIVQVSPAQVDFGDIDQDGGIVSSVVSVENTGDALLEIHRLSTSCGCTTAQMDTSPILPGEKREMTITFDPLVHPDQSGPIIRVVYLQTSDAANPEIEIDVVGNVVNKNDEL